MVFENILDPVFNPLLKLHPGLAIFLVSLIITLLITLVYKFTTDQKKMKKLKEEMKEHQKKIRELSKKDPQKAMALQQEAMKGNLEYMKSSFKSTLYTLIPIIIIFGWLNSHMAYYPISPGQEFSFTASFAEGHAPEVSLSTIPELEIISDVTQPIEGGQASWRLKGEEGEYNLIVAYNGEQYEQPLIISSEHKYAPPEKTFSNSKLKKTMIGNEKIYPLQDFGIKLNWLWTYIIFSVLMSMGLRKLMKLY
ncbi:DUF106 domain-containing protein [Candidatus Woesearchaeota archaeon]|nr:DUF106 domain-containing protein [Candidatus Woesearchaeota archaeon]